MRFVPSQASQDKPDQPSQAKPSQPASQPANWPSKTSPASQPSWPASDQNQPSQSSQARPSQPRRAKPASHKPAKPSQPDHPPSQASQPAKPSQPFRVSGVAGQRCFLTTVPQKMTRGDCQKLVLGDPGGLPKIGVGRPGESAKKWCWATWGGHCKGIGMGWVFYDIFSSLLASLCLPLTEPNISQSAASPREIGTRWILSALTFFLLPSPSLSPPPAPIA